MTEKMQRNLTGQRFGRWTVLGPALADQVDQPAQAGQLNQPVQADQQKGREKRWLCLCDCGTERLVLERSLLYGGSKSCGCEAREKARQSVELKLEGQSFGELTVLRKLPQEEVSSGQGSNTLSGGDVNSNELYVGDKPGGSGDAGSRGDSDQQQLQQTHSRRRGTWWLCRCSCGTETAVQGTLLVNGKKTHCGCRTAGKKGRSRAIDISGQKFNYLTALKLTDKRNQRGQALWHCRCDCGREVDVTYNDLVYTNLMSCGCRKLEHNASLAQTLTHVDGTSMDFIRSKRIPSNNTTGIRGVYMARGKFAAKIVFQKKQYHLGFYDTLEAAAQARKEAENVLFDGAVSHYEWWKEQAASDQTWAENNPFRVHVQKLTGGGLEVTFSPER